MNAVIYYKTYNHLILISSFLNYSLTKVNTALMQFNAKDTTHYHLPCILSYYYQFQTHPLRHLLHRSHPLHDLSH